MGEALYRVASIYRTVLEAILEQVQNALDAKAKEISIFLNRKTRHIAVRDDGNGVSLDRFDKALKEICRTQKTETELGRFGFGLISPLDKCNTFIFTSSSRDSNDGYMEWMFNSRMIRSQVENPGIPRRPRPDLVFGHRGLAASRGHTVVPWRTEMRIESYVADKVISRISSIEELIEAILNRFSVTMRRNGVSLNIKFVNEDGTTEVKDNVRAKLFTGRPLSEVTIEEKDVGSAVFRIFLAPRTTKGQNGKVLVGELRNDYRIPFKTFVRTAEGILAEEIVVALNSGVFEGEILGKRIALNADRKSFEKDEALVGLCVAIEEWYKKHGAKHLEEVKEANRDQRYQALGLKSLNLIHEMLKMPQFADLRKVVGGFKHGTVGGGHTRRPKAIQLGIQTEKSLSATGIEEDGGGGEGGSGGGRGSPRKDKPNHTPFTATGPRGVRRLVVKGDSPGLQFSYVAIDGSDRLWELDSDDGILHFNVNHETWVAVQDSDRKVEQLQETIAVFALETELMPSERAEDIRFAFEETLVPLSHLFRFSPAFNLRKLSKAEKAK